jgi:hypothetical protein
VTAVFIIPPGKRVAVSVNGSDFRIRVLEKHLQFGALPELSETDATFVDGQRRIRVDRDDVILARFDGQGGAHQFVV